MSKHKALHNFGDARPINDCNKNILVLSSQKTSTFYELRAL